ncbi:MAG: glycosyltransferase N-terminal domain-containing protein, partial [Planctomycetota bacterium]
YFPLDFSFIMLRAFRMIRPSICLLMEQEVWPNFVNFAQLFDVPVVVVNGRISDKAFARYEKFKLISKIIYRKVTLISSR